MLSPMLLVTPYSPSHSVSDGHGSARHGGPLHTDTAPRSEHSARQRAADSLARSYFYTTSSWGYLMREIQRSSFLMSVTLAFLFACGIDQDNHMFCCFAPLNANPLYFPQNLVPFPMQVSLAGPIEWMCDNTSSRIAWMIGLDVDWMADTRVVKVRWCGHHTAAAV